MAKITDIVGKNLALKALNIAASRVYHYFTDKKLVNVGGYIGDVAQKYGLERKLDEYNESLINRLKGYLAYLGHLTNYLRYGSPTLESKQYVAAKTADDLIARLLGYTTHWFQKQGKAVYLSDIRNYETSIGKTHYKLDKLLELGKDLYDKTSIIMYEASRRTKLWLTNQIREQKGIESIAHKEGLERRVVGGVIPEGAGTLTEYRNLMRTEKPVVYYQDIGRHSYATV